MQDPSAERDFRWRVLRNAAPAANSCAAAGDYDRNFRTACKIEMAPGESLRDAWRGCVEESNT